jgi:hypothetical protein
VSTDAIGQKRPLATDRSLVSRLGTPRMLLVTWHCLRPLSVFTRYAFAFGFSAEEHVGRIGWHGGRGAELAKVACALSERRAFACSRRDFPLRLQRRVAVAVMLGLTLASLAQGAIMCAGVRLGLRRRTSSRPLPLR